MIINSEAISRKLNNPNIFLSDKIEKFRYCFGLCRDMSSRVNHNSRVGTTTMDMRESMFKDVKKHNGQNRWNMLRTISPIDSVRGPLTTLSTDMSHRNRDKENGDIHLKLRTYNVKLIDGCIKHKYVIYAYDLSCAIKTLTEIFDWIGDINSLTSYTKHSLTFTHPTTLNLTIIVSSEDELFDIDNSIYVNHNM